MKKSDNKNIEDIFVSYPDERREASREKLKSTTVFVAGAGGGGSIPILQLALFGFGTIKICDFGEIDLTDLNRLFLPVEEHLGMNKALSAEIIVNKIYPDVKVSSCTQKLDRSNVFDLVADAGIIFDTFVNPVDRFILSECAVAKGIPHVIISTSGMGAYAAVFHTPKTACYHCIFDKKKLEIIISGMKENVKNYRKNKLAAVSTSLSISSVIAINAALKILLDFNNPGYNKFFYYNQEGKSGNFVHTTGYKAMTHLFSTHFRQLCREQGFDWDIGWRGKYLEELTIIADPDCLLCGERAVRKGAKQ
jgi:molybdopterin/thiamine biosynthesis adenylyltransferase